jgi:hypothetical protein
MLTSRLLKRLDNLSLVLEDDEKKKSGQPAGPVKKHRQRLSRETDPAGKSRGFNPMTAAACHRGVAASWWACLEACSTAHEPLSSAGREAGLCRDCSAAR